MRVALAGKHVLVTGGSAGIGLSLARRLVQLGASVTILARTPDKLEKALQELQQLVVGFKSKKCAPLPRAQAQTADVTDLQQVRGIL